MTRKENFWLVAAFVGWQGRGSLSSSPRKPSVGGGAGTCRMYSICLIAAGPGTFCSVCTLSSPTIRVMTVRCPELDLFPRCCSMAASNTSFI